MAVLRKLLLGDHGSIDIVNSLTDSCQGSDGRHLSAIDLSESISSQVSNSQINQFLGL